jgi:hypothetical protein
LPVAVRAARARSTEHKGGLNMKAEYFILVAVVASALQAQNAPTKTLKILTPEQIDPGQLLPAAPAEARSRSARNSKKSSG